MGLTLQERYYEINKRLRVFLRDNGFDVPVVKYGVDFATTKTETKSQDLKYPYFQTHLKQSKPQSWTSNNGGQYTVFRYYVSFFASPKTEYIKDSENFKVFELARVAFSDVNADLLRIDPLDLDSGTLADVLDIEVDQDFGEVSGAIVPSGIIIVKMAAVIGYPINLPEPSDATNIDAAIEITSA